MFAQWVKAFTLLAEGWGLESESCARAFALHAECSVSNPSHVQELWPRMLKVGCLNTGSEKPKF